MLTNPQLTTVKLGGHLGRKFGRVHRLAVKSPAEAVRALEANFPGFRAHVLAHSEPGYHVLVGKRDITAEELALGTSQRVIRIVPVVQGSKSPWVSIVIGAALIYFSGGLGAAAAGTFGGTAAAWSTVAVGLGSSMVMGGVSQLLAGNPASMGAQERPENKPSYLFDGPVNTEAQGHPIPFGCGTLRVGGARISASIRVRDYDPGGDDSGTGFRVTNREAYDFPYDSDLGATGADVSQALRALDGAEPYTWSIVDDPGEDFTINTSGAYDTLEATALPAADYRIGVKATDTDTLEATKTITFHVYDIASGGKGYDPTLIGGSTGGGGGGSAQHVPVEAPDGLQSEAIANLVFAVCEGPIEGLVDGLKSVYLNGTPVQGPDDGAEPTYNFQNVRVDYRLGTQDQGYIPGFPSTESEIADGRELKQGSPGPLVITVTDSNVDQVRVTIGIPSLTASADNGDLNGTSVSFHFDLQCDSGGYVPVIQDTISDKTTSRYQRSYSIPVKKLGPAPWDIRITRDTADSASVQLTNKTYVDSYTKVIDSKLRYPNTVVFAVQANAKSFTSIPQCAFHLKLQHLLVPSNYTPASYDFTAGTWTSGSYSGSWDGTFIMAHTYNPAWALFYLLTESRFGLGDWISEDQVDKWAFYQIAQYCDQMVDDGYGGLEPRFTCNLYLQTQEDAFRVIANLASIFRGMAYWASGSVYAAQDRPSDPVYLFTESNVQDGLFTYSGSARKARHNVALVSWSDPADGYKQKVEYVEDAEAIEEMGFVSQSEVVAMGCTSRGQAHRLGRWLLYTERYETETVTFSTGYEGIQARPGDVILVQDQSRVSKRFGGRLLASDGSTHTLDSEVEIESGKTYTLWALLPSGEPAEVEVTNAPGVTATITTAAFSEAPGRMAQWILSASDLEPQTFRVLGVVEAAPELYEITALKHNPSKYAYVESGLTLEDPNDGTGTGTGSPNAGGANIQPQNVTISEYLQISGIDVKTVMRVSCDAVTKATSYSMEFRRDSGSFIKVADSTSPSFEVSDVVPGYYSVRVYAKVDNIQSPPGKASANIYGKTAPPADVANFISTVQGSVLAATWDAVADLDLDYYTIRTPGAGATDAIKWAAGTTVVGCEKLTVTFATLVRPATGSYDYWIKAVDTSGNESVNPTKLTIAVNALDDYVTPTEKRSWKTERDLVIAEQSGLDTKADSLGVSRTAYDAAITALTTFLGTLTGSQGWSGTDWASYTADYYLGNATPATTGVAFYGKFKDVWAARDALLSAILAATVSTPTDAFRPALRWDFGDGSDAGFSLSGATSADTPSPLAKVARRITATGTDPQLISPTFSLSGVDARVLVARVRLVSGTWAGEAYFKGTSPSVGSFTTSNYKSITAPVVGQWTDLAWDMANLTAGGTNYIANTDITQVRFDFCNTNGAVVDVDWIAPGTYGAGSKADYDNALYQGILDAVANGNVVVLGTTVISNGNNLIPNPKSELTAAMLPAGSLGLVSIDSTGLGYNSSTGCRKVLAGATATITARRECKANETYYVSAMAKVSGAATGELQVEAFNIAGTSLGNIAMSAGYSTTSTSYTLIYGQATMPANAASFIVKLKCTSGTYALFDELGCLRCADAALLVNGSVTALIIAASAVQTHHMAVGPNYQFTTTAGGSPLLMNNDGTFSANTVNGAVENSVDAASYMDAARLYPSTKQKTFEANFLSPTGQDRGFLINMSSAFSSVSTGLRILHSGSAITVKPVTGTRTYGAALTPTTTPNSVPAAGTGKLTAVWASDSGTSCSRRLVIKCDGVEVQTYSDAAIGATNQGQQGGYAGILLGTHATRPGDVKAWGLALGIGVVTIGDGVVDGNTFIADLALVNVVRSPNYVAGSAGTPPTGFKMSGSTFTTTFYDGTTASTNLEIGSAANLGGEKVGGVINKIKGNSTSWSGAGTNDWICPEGITSIDLTLQAPGGNGATGAGTGGTGGQYIRREVTVKPHNTYRVTNGAVGSNSTFAWLSFDGTSGFTTDSGFTTITATCGANGTGGGLTGLKGDSAANPYETPEDGWTVLGATGGDSASAGAGPAGDGGDVGTKTGGSGASAIGWDGGGGGGASAMANGGLGALNRNHATGVAAAGTLGSGGGSGYTPGAGGPSFSRIRH